MQINHHFTQEVFIPSTNGIEEVTVYATCDCEEIRKQSDVGYMNDYLELEGITIDSVYFGDEEITDLSIYAAILKTLSDDNYDRIQTQINEEN